MQKLSSLANIGNFLIGCALLYVALRPAGLSPASASNGATVPVTSSIPATFWIFLAGIILAGVLNLAAAFVHPKTNPRAVPHPIHAAGVLLPTGDGRIFLGAEVNAQMLKRMCIDRTTVEAQRLIKPYLGKWMKVSGALENITERTGGGFHVQLNGRADGLFFLFFDKNWDDHLVILNKGSEVTAIGKIGTVETNYISLDKCELLG